MDAKVIYKTLYARFGPQGWWPIQGEYKKRGKLAEQEQVEICAGAILTQNTSWKNAERALENLTAAGMLSLKRLAKCRTDRLAALIRPAGYYNQKTKRLKLFAKRVISRHGSMNAMLNQPMDVLRHELLSLHGIGPETADSIVLYAALWPSFVIDAYTKRICNRLGWIDACIGYDELQATFHKQLPLNARLFNECHALFVELAKKHCTKHDPACHTCPLHRHCSFSKNLKQPQC